MPQDFEVVVTACFFGHLETLEDVLQEHAEDTKAEVQARGLYWAARNGHTQIVHRLLVEDVSPDAIIVDGQTALIAAAQFDRPYCGGEHISRAGTSNRSKDKNNTQRGDI
jgi:hypothetical protein